MRTLAISIPAACWRNRAQQRRQRGGLEHITQSQPKQPVAAARIKFT